MKNKKKIGILCVTVIASILIGGCENKINKSPDNENKVNENNQNSIDNNESIDDDKQESTANDEQKLREVNIYFINEDTGNLETKVAEISDEKAIWEQLQETGAITEECQLLSFSLNESEKKIDLEFNKATGDRIRNMGTTGETEILACIINTYLDAYECDGIKLAEEGEPLETSSGADFNGYSSKIEL